MTQQGPPIAFRGIELERSIDERAGRGQSRNEIAKRDLDRYYDMLRRSLPTFTQAEAHLLVEACGEWRIEPHSASFLWAKVDEAIRSTGLDQERSVDGPALVARLRSLTPFEVLAVCDAIERFRRNPDPADESLAQVGLVR